MQHFLRTLKIRHASSSFSREEMRYGCSRDDDLINNLILANKKDLLRKLKERRKDEDADVNERMIIGVFTVI